MIPNFDVFLVSTMFLKDSAVAFQALTEYANRARIRDITEMSIKVETSSQGEDAEPFIFDPDSASASQQVDVSVNTRSSFMRLIKKRCIYSVDRKSVGPC